jgi:hypothetical protein
MKILKSRAHLIISSPRKEEDQREEKRAKLRRPRKPYQLRKLRFKLKFNTKLKIV